MDATNTKALDHLIGRVKAELALLEDELRVAITDSDKAEAAAQSLDDSAAYAFLVMTLAQRIAAERAELSKEVLEAQARATGRILAARAEGAALVASVHADGQDVVAPAAPTVGVPPSPSAGHAPLPTVREPADQLEPHGGRVNGKDLEASQAHVRPAAPPPLPSALSAKPPPAPGPPTVAPFPVATAGRRTGIRRFLYVDTVLPLVAALIVLIVLIAWIG